MKITVNSVISISEPTKEVENFIKSELEIKNPEIQKKLAMGFWTGNIPKTLKAYSKKGWDYIIPLGEINNIWNLHPHLDDYIIDFGYHEQLDFPQSNIKLYDYQEKAVEYMQKQGRGILQSKCGSGKSIMALELIKRIGYKALIICEKKEIQDQFKTYLEKNYGMQRGDYGLIKEGNVEIGNFVTIALRQTLARIDLTQYKYEWGTIVVDECFSGDTEILTEKGFVRFDELDKNSKVAQYNEDGTLNFVNPIRYIEKDVNEYVSFKYKDIEIKTTLNHNMIAKSKANTQKIYKIKAQDFTNKKLNDYYMLNTAVVKANNKQVLAPIQKIGIMLQADGTVYHLGKKETTWRLDFSKPRKIEEFKKICKEANISYKENLKREFKNLRWNNSYSFIIKLPNKDYKTLTNFLEIPKNKKYALDIINEIKKWDSYITSHNIIEYNSTNYENVKFIQTVAIMCGLKCGKFMEIKEKNGNRKTIYRIYIGNTQNIYYQRFKKTIKKEKTRTYCVEVPTNMIVCRKDNFVFITGNCQNVGGSVTKCTQYSKILNNLTSKYRYGVSATGYRVDGLTRFMYSLLNTVKYEIPEEAISDKIIKAAIKPIYTNYQIGRNSLKYDGTINYTVLPTNLATDDSRNKLIADLLRQEKDNYCLILSDRLEGLELLHKEIGGLFINGQMTSKKAKQEREEAIEKMRNKQEHYLFASFSLARERT